MEHLVAIMFLVGCGPDGSSCHEIPAPTPFYASIEECETRLGLEMRLTGTLDRRLLGTCAAVDPGVLDTDATLDWAVSRSGELRVEVTAGPSVLAAGDDVASAEVQVASR